MMTVACRQDRQQVAIDQAPRCWRCGRKLAEYAGRPWQMVCERCKARNSSEPQTSAQASAIRPN